MTSTDITNLALTEIGANLIDTLDGETRIRLVYDQALALLLEEHPWNFAEIIVELPLISPVPTAKPGRYDYAFDLPANYRALTLLEANGHEVAATDYKISGRTLWSLHASLTLTYTAADPNVSTWPAAFTEAFTALLASRLARTLLQSEQEADRLLGLFSNLHLPAAKKSDTRDSPGSMAAHSLTPAQASPMVQARRSWHPRYVGVNAPD